MPIILPAFTDFKHSPSRPQIDSVLGVLPAIELKRFEEKLDMLEPRIQWSMQWYEVGQVWGYRAAFRTRVVCILHFSKGFFTASVSVPVAREQEFHDIRGLSDSFREQFKYFTMSPKVKWFTFRIKKRADTDSLLAVIALKMQDLYGKTGKAK